MEYEKKYEAEIIGKTIGEELRKAFRNNNRHDIVKEYREEDEYRYKNLLYFINVSVIISYIAGALVIQLPFIDKFGIISYDFKLYLLIGAIVFVIIQIAVFISTIYEQFASGISSAIRDFITNKLNNFESQGLDWLIKVVLFIPLSSFIINFCEEWISVSVTEKYIGVLVVILLFIRIYIALSLVFQNKRYSSRMNTTHFILIIMALISSIYLGRASFEEYLLTDAKLINNQYEKSIELLLIDNKAIYYKENNTYKYEILKENAIIEFIRDNN